MVRFGKALVAVRTPRPVGFKGLAPAACRSLRFPGLRWKAPGVPLNSASRSPRTDFPGACFRMVGSSSRLLPNSFPAAGTGRLAAPGAGALPRLEDSVGRIPPRSVSARFNLLLRKVISIRLILGTTVAHTPAKHRKDTETDPWRVTLLPALFPCREAIRPPGGSRLVRLRTHSAIRFPMEHFDEKQPLRPRHAEDHCRDGGGNFCLGKSRGPMAK